MVWAQSEECHVPISQKRELEIERGLAWIMRELDRRPSFDANFP
jgi:hypothetical protein